MRGFILLLIMFNPTTSSRNAKYLHKIPLKCSSVISCQHKTNYSGTISWYYKNDTHGKAVRIAFEGKGGVIRQQPMLREVSVLLNGSLAIKSFKENHQGHYKCCSHANQNTCEHERWTKVETANLEESHIAFYITTGGNFTHECPKQFKKWTFDGLYPRSVVRFESFDKNIHIVNVTREDAGTYTCWTSACAGHEQKILVINLCVITVQHNENLLDSCDVTCQKDFNPIKTYSALQMKTGSMISVHVDPYGSVICKATGRGNRIINRTNGSLNASNTTSDMAHIQPSNNRSYGASATALCLTLVVLSLCCLRAQLQRGSVSSDRLCGYVTNGRIEDDDSVIYASVKLRTSDRKATTGAHIEINNTVYGEIKI